MKARCVGYFHLWTETTLAGAYGRRRRRLDPGIMPNHKAQQKLAQYIEEYTGKLIHQRESIERSQEE